VELNIPDETKESIGKLYSGRKIRWNLDIACLALAVKNLPPSIFLFSFSFPSVNIGTKIAILRIGISTISLDHYQVNLGRQDIRKKRGAGPLLP